MMGQRELLIDEVKKFPILYNTQHENHKDIEMRDRCWLEISQRIGENSEVLKREWKILRDSYRQVVKKKGKVKRNGLPTRKWRFEGRMAYLLPFMTERGSGFRRPVKYSKTQAQDAEGHSDSDTQYPTPVEAVEVDKPEPWEPPPPASGSHQVDALELFFSSVCQSTIKLPKKMQNRVKREVLDVVMRAEEECEEEERSGRGDTKVNIFNNL